MSFGIAIKRVQSQEEAERGFCCMSEVPTPWPGAAGLCRAWVSQNLGRHVEGYHMEASDGAVVGQLYFALSEQALIPYEVEPGVAVLYCEWVQRRYQKQELGRQLFGVFEAEMRGEGCKGILVEATDREDRMHYRHYLARGFRTVHDAGSRKLLYLGLSQPAATVRPYQPLIQPRRGSPVEIVVLSGYLCPFETSTQMLLLEVAREFGDRVRVRQEPLNTETLRRYGVTDGIFINGYAKLAGGASEEEIRQAIVEEM